MVLKAYPKARHSSAAVKHAGHLPDFCANHSVFLVIIIAELLAILFTLTSAENIRDFWIDLALTSLFIQWVALGTAAILCSFAGFITRLNILRAILLSYGLTQLVTLVFSLLSFWVMNRGMGFNSLSTNLSHTLWRNLAISSIICLIALRYFYVQHQWKQNVEAQAQAQFEALQARIRPHFLFNSLNTIASLTHSQPEQAEQAILDLADLFRSTLEQPNTISLGEELATSRRYLHIESLRLGERLQVNWQVDETLALDTPIPALILQPLLENAVYHGIQPLPAGGCIDIHIQSNNDKIIFSISNPLPNTNMIANASGHQLAQDNIRQRLILAYGKDSQLKIEKSNYKYCVSFVIPIQ